MTIERFRLIVSATTPVGISHSVTVSSSAVPTSASSSALRCSSVIRKTSVAVDDVWNANQVPAWYPNHTRAVRPSTSDESARRTARTLGGYWRHGPGNHPTLEGAASRYAI